jgi:hypothetical protein
VSGPSFNIDANVGPISPTVSFDADGFNGLALGFGPGTGLSVSTVFTDKFTIQDWLKNAPIIAEPWPDPWP